METESSLLKSGQRYDIIEIDTEPLPDQAEVFNSEAKLNSVPSTRRSGKSSGIIYYSIINGLKGKHIAIVFPTHDDSKDTLLRLQGALHDYIKSIDKSSLIIRLVSGGSIRFFSYEAFSRIRGKKFHIVYCDEFQECRLDESYFWAALLPTLSDYQGQAFFFGTPKKGTLLHAFSQKKEPEWRHFKMRADRNPAISPEEIALQKRILPPLVYAQEWEGEFVDFDLERWLYEFKPEIHLETGLTVDPDARMLLQFDFNYDPTTCLISQKIEAKAEDGGGINFIKEITVKGGTLTLCRDVRRYLETLHTFKGAIYVTGDVSGSARDTRSSRTDYEIIRDELGIPFTMFIDTRKMNPSLSLSRDICNVAFYHNLIYIDSEKCPILAADCSKAKPKDGTDQLLKDRGAYKLDSFDAMRYGIHAYFKNIEQILQFSRIVNE